MIGFCWYLTHMHNQGNHYKNSRPSFMPSRMDVCMFVLDMRLLSQLPIQLFQPHKQHSGLLRKINQPSG
jgi:hypothetical protein